MSKTKTIIKGLILATLFVGVFGLNMNYVDSRASTNGKQTQSQLTMVQWGGTRVMAQVGGDTNASVAAQGEGADAAALQAAGESGKITKVQVVTDPKLVLNQVAAYSMYVNKIFNPLIHFFTFKIGAFLGNDYIFDGKMGEMLHGIWVINRNIVNIVFVLVLLFLALKHIFMEEDAGIAKSLPQFAIMLIAVNFSWLAGKLILDAANVTTNIIFAIPSGLNQGNLDSINSAKKCEVNTDQNAPVSAGCVPKEGVNILDWGAEDTENYYVETSGTCTPEWIKERETKIKENENDPNSKKVNVICWEQMKIENYSQNTASYYLSYSMAKVQNLPRATGKKIDQLLVGTVFAIALQTVYLGIFLALTVVLIMRFAAMWILMAFSPFIVLLMYMGKIGIDPDAKGAGEFLSLKGFAKWAFAPAKVGAVWTVGFIMVTAGQAMDWKAGADFFGVQSLFSGMDSVQQLIWFIMTLAIIWIGTFAIFSDLEVAKDITEGIKTRITGLGSLAAREAGTRIPFAPVTGAKDGKMMTATETWDALKAMDKIVTGPKGPGAGAADSQTKGKVEAIIKIGFETGKIDELKKKFEGIGLQSKADLTKQRKDDIMNDERYGSKDDRKKLLEIAEKTFDYIPGTAPAPAPAPAAPTGAPPAAGAPTRHP